MKLIRRQQKEEDAMEGKCTVIKKSNRSVVVKQEAGETSVKRLNFNTFLFFSLVIPQQQSSKKTEGKASKESRTEKMDTS